MLCGDSVTSLGVVFGETHRQVSLRANTLSERGMRTEMHGGYMQSIVTIDQCLRAKTRVLQARVQVPK